MPSLYGKHREFGAKEDSVILSSLINTCLVPYQTLLVLRHISIFVVSDISARVAVSFKYNIVCNCYRKKSHFLIIGESP